MTAAHGLTFQRMTELAASAAPTSTGSMASTNKPDPEDEEVRDAVHRIALEVPRFGRPRGSPRNCAAKAGGSTTNGSAGSSPEDNLLCLCKRKFVVTTTDSKHGPRSIRIWTETWNAPASIRSGWPAPVSGGRGVRPFVDGGPGRLLMPSHHRPCQNNCRVLELARY